MHRNVLIDSTEHARVADFGLSRAVHSEGILSCRTTLAPITRVMKFGQGKTLSYTTDLDELSCLSVGLYVSNVNILFSHSNFVFYRRQNA